MGSVALDAWGLGVEECGCGGAFEVPRRGRLGGWR